MDLDGEVVGCVDEFKEEGELGAEVVEDLLAEELAHVYLGGLCDGALLEEAVGDDGLVAGEAGEGPKLAAVGERLVVEAERLNLVAPPDLILEEGEEFERIESGVHGLFFN